jgi:hypothetical protein
MTNKPRDTGTSFETDVKDYFNERDLGAERTGSAAFGLADIHFGPGKDWTAETKATQEIDLPGTLDQLDAAVERRGTQGLKSVAIFKHRRKPIGKSYAAMSLENYRRLVIYVSLLEILMEAFTGMDLSDPQVFKNFILANDKDGLFA